MWAGVRVVVGRLNVRPRIHIALVCCRDGGCLPSCGASLLDARAACSRRRLMGHSRPSVADTEDPGAAAVSAVLLQLLYVC